MTERVRWWMRKEDFAWMKEMHDEARTRSAVITTYPLFSDDVWLEFTGMGDFDD